MDSRIKSEPLEFSFPTPLSMRETSNPRSVVDLISSSDSDSNDDGLCGTVSSKKRNRVSNAALEAGPSKKKRFDDEDFSLPAGFLDPLPSAHAMPVLQPAPISQVPPAMHQPLPVLQAAPPMSQPWRNVSRDQACKQFWKAGDYEMDSLPNSNNFTGGIDHVRVHPKFLHSNATSHKWALGAFAELLDNSLDEVCNGATYVNIDMLESRKDGSKMLLIEDNGGGMDPEKIRQCMSLGYSAKSKQANTIGQYGNGFKTSTMRLGADVLVFSRCCGKDGKSPTQSIGMLSYTFLRSTKREDIIVPMVDYEKEGKDWRRLIRSSPDDWARIAETIVQWSPYFSEADLLLQFHSMTDHGTRIIIYNLWEDDRGELELDFGADQFDIQLRGVNREDKKIQMAAQFPNSKHFLTYRHSLRSYASILYLRLPPRFRIILRGKDVEHHNILNDMMMVQEHTYRPQASADGVPRDPADMVAVVKLGFVKDAENHIDVQGFNVYHKNRLIKPFWRLWNPAGSDGRGVIGLLEANFVEPAHDKQGFERTTVLQRLETRLVQMQKQYWCENCHKIGYAPRRSKKLLEVYSDKQEAHTPSSVVPLSMQPQDPVQSNDKRANRRVSTDKSKFGKKSVSPTSRFRGSLSPEGYESDCEIQRQPHDGLVNAQCNGNGRDHGDLVTSPTRLLEEENRKLTERLTKLEESKMLELQFERDKNKSLEAQIRDLERKLDEVNKEQEALIDIFSEERSRRDREEDNLRRKLKDASNTIQELLDKEMTMYNGTTIKRE